MTCDYERTSCKWRDKVVPKLEADNAKLRKALAKYSYHSAECTQGPFQYDFTDPKPCNCGLDELLKGFQ